MKIYTYLKLDLDYNVIEEESFEYEGQIAKCDGSDSDGGYSSIGGPAGVGTAAGRAHNRSLFGNTPAGSSGPGKGTGMAGGGGQQSVAEAEANAPAGASGPGRGTGMAGGGGMASVAEVAEGNVAPNAPSEVGMHGTSYAADEYGRPKNIMDLPKVFNKDKAKWGYRVGSTIGSFLGPTNPFGSLFAGVAGGLIGGFMDAPSGPLSESMQSTMDAGKENRGGPDNDGDRRITPVAPTTPPTPTGSQTVADVEDELDLLDAEIEARKKINERRRQQLGYLQTRLAQTTGVPTVFSSGLF